MKILLIIYGISWLILLTVYVASLFSKKNNTSEKESWYLYALIIALAPLCVLLIPYLLISSYITKMKQKKQEKKREQKKAEENAYKQHAMLELEAAMEKPQKNLSSVQVMPAQNLVKRIKEKDYDSFMQYLKHLSLPDGASLHVKECSQEGAGDVSKLYIKTPEGANDMNIWDYIKAEKSIDGAWDAYFLSKVWHILPLWWHANYGCRTYLYSKEDAKNIHLLLKSEQDVSHIRKNVSPLISEPEVIQSDEKFFVRCCYWTNFGGLIKETVEIIISPEGKVSFKDIGGESLYDYDCGIMF